MTHPERFLLPKGLPTLDALVKLATALTGRPPTPEEIEAARARLEAMRSRGKRRDDVVSPGEGRRP